MRYLTVTLNPALDRNYIVPNFTVGEVQRAERVGVHPGGKGINVARMLRTLGANGIATGFLGGASGKTISNGLAFEGIPADFVDISPLETRLAIVLLDAANGTQTVVNEIGPELNDEYYGKLRDKIAKLSVTGDVVVFTGSLPPGVPIDAYKVLIDECKSRGIITLLDSSGDALRDGIKSKPTIVKPNRAELSALGIDISDWSNDAPAAVKSLRDKFDLDYAVVTGGADGAVLACSDGVFSAKMPRLENIVSAVGSGDSFAAGLAWSLGQKSFDPEFALRLASACGAANALNEGGGSATWEQIDLLSGRITIDRHV